jgi:hypothetical protein
MPLYSNVPLYCSSSPRVAGSIPPTRLNRPKEIPDSLSKGCRPYKNHAEHIVFFDGWPKLRQIHPVGAYENPLRIKAAFQKRSPDKLRRHRDRMSFLIFRYTPLKTICAEFRGRKMPVPMLFFQYLLLFENVR